MRLSAAMTSVGCVGGRLLRISGWRLRRSIETSYIGNRTDGKINKYSPTERRNTAERATGKANEKHLMEKVL